MLNLIKQVGVRLFITRKTVMKRIRDAEVLRLVVGAGATKYPGWISIEKYILDVTKREDWVALLGSRKVDNILSEHVFEHLEYENSIQAFCNIAEFLADGGVFRWAVPDGYHPSAYVRKLTGTHGTELGADSHKYFYTIDDIPEIEDITGLKAVPLEFFCKDGFFVGNPIDSNKGYIQRCSKNYKGRFFRSEKERGKMLDSVPTHLRGQFVERGFSYASLLCDWIKVRR